MNRRGPGRLPHLLPATLLIGIAGAVSAQPPELRETVRPAFDAEYRVVLVEVERRLEAAPDDPVLNYYAGICSYFLDEIVAAEKYLRRAVENQALFPEAYYWLVRLLAEEAEWSEARGILRSGLEWFPGNEKLLLLDARLPGKESSAGIAPQK